VEAVASSVKQKENVMIRKAVAVAVFVGLSSTIVSFPVLAADAAAPKKVTAQDLANTPPSGTLEFDGTQIRLLIGGSSGKGVLHFQGKQYPFTAKSLSVGGVGVAEVHAVGDVHYLTNVSDFAGVYTGLTIGATAVKGKGAATFQNSKGVVLSVKAKTDGVALSLGVSGFEVSLVK
jgi:hypothetical protein